MKKKIVMVLLSMVMCLSIFAGCNGGGGGIDPNSAQKLEIYVYNAGYGYKWAEDILAAFKNEDWVKEKYPELKTSFTQDAVGTQSGFLVSGPKGGNKYDVVFGTWLYDYMGQGGRVANLTESVYNQTVPGESILYKEKMQPSYLEGAAFKEKSGSQDQYYTVHWASGMGGLYYNKTKVEALGFTAPNTTNEFVKIMADVKQLGGSNPVYPQTTSFPTWGNSDYEMYLFNTWWAQYEGTDEYINYYKGIDSSTGGRDAAIFSQNGRLKSLEVIESFLSKGKGYVQISNNTGREAYLETQNRVVLGTSLFMANGDWVDNETKTLQATISDVITTLRTPIISSIVEKLSVIKTDAALSKTVEHVDGKITKAQLLEALSLSESSELNSDINKVLAARKVVYSIGANHTAVIPSYASGMGPATDFLRYLATDKANELYLKATGGAALPFNYDVETKNSQLFNQFSSLQKDRIRYFNELNVYTLPSERSFILSRLGKVSVFASDKDNPLYKYTTGEGYSGYTSLSEKIFQTDIKYWTENSNIRWNQALTQAGLN